MVASDLRPALITRRLSDGMPPTAKKSACVEFQTCKVSNFGLNFCCAGFKQVLRKDSFFSTEDPQKHWIMSSSIYSLDIWENSEGISREY